MPTGYTCNVADGSVTDLKTFAHQLARGMGALVPMRDAPHDAPIPERFQPSSYSLDKLEALNAEIKELRALTPEQVNARNLAAQLTHANARRVAEAKFNETRDNYANMIAKVIDWQGAPEGLKEFALEQLNTGLAFDCGRPFVYYGEVETVEKRLNRAVSDAGYHSANYADEVASTNGRNVWLAQLHASLKDA